MSGRTFDGFVLPSRPAGQLRLISALRWHPFASRPMTTDWLAMTEGGSAADLEVTLVNENGDTVSRVADRIGNGPSVVSLPGLCGPSTLEGDRSLDLVLCNRATDASAIILLVKEIDSAGPFLTLANGMEVELLNGQANLLAPSPDRDLFYVGSEVQIEATATPVPPGGDRWSQALVGRSHDIPIVDNELDFILASEILHRAAATDSAFARRTRSMIRLSCSDTRCMNLVRSSMSAKPSASRITVTTSARPPCSAGSARSLRPPATRPGARSSTRSDALLAQLVLEPGELVPLAREVGLDPDLAPPAAW